MHAARETHGDARASSAENARDHLFISYAIEDLSFVRWLALKLSACGYRIWWDRERLHGGASFPTEIDSAIKTGTFRMLAVLSHHSSHKPNPERERSIALAIGRERKEDFLIPLNLELSATELPWMMSNLTFVPFMENWSVGLRQLLDDLRASGAPCYPEESAALVRANLAQPTFVVEEPEDVWLNVFAITDIPAGLSRYEWTQDVSDQDLAPWAYQREGARVCWAFEAPPDLAGVRKPARDQYALAAGVRIRGINLNHVATSLLRQYLENRCRARGLVELVDGRGFFFPDTLPVASHLPFTLPNGRVTWLRPVGTCRVWQRGQPEQLKHHLAFSFRIELSRLGAPVLQVRPMLHFTTMDGGPVDPARNVRRAKAVRKKWFNDKWLARVAAIGSYLAEGAPTWKLSERLATTVSGAPLRLKTNCRLDESARTEALKPDETDEADDTDLVVEDFDAEEGDD